jgi:L-seryl-tRNA(Ser) seleniumtransferase
MKDRKQKILRQIPSVNDLLASDLAQDLVDRYSRPLLVEGIRSVTDQIRDEVLSSTEDDLTENFMLSNEDILRKVEEHLLIWSRPKLSPAVNATGVIVHTNLGRSLLSDSSCEAITKIAKNYSTLEIDRESGQRGSRYDNLTGLLKELTGAEAAMVVNNNAGAVLLALNTLAEGKEVIISRGELVEIGGSFRIPDVMKRSGAKLVEVGATNKVYLKDYSNMVNENTGLLLKVHTSNFRILAFTQGVDLEELVEYSADKDLPVMDDLGSGILLDLTDSGLSYEPTVQNRIEAGTDIVTFSGDKLLGGPQAGIIVGKKKYIDKMKKNPLTRALRVDKFTLAALEATLKEYKSPNSVRQNIPTLKMLTLELEDIKKQAKSLLRQLKGVVNEQFELSLCKDISRVGGGAFPLEELPTYTVKILPQKISAKDFSYKLRMNYPPIFTRISDQTVIIDLRTVKEEDIEIIVAAIADICGYI